MSQNDLFKFEEKRTVLKLQQRLRQQVKLTQCIGSDTPIHVLLSLRLHDHF